MGTPSSPVLTRVAKLYSRISACRVARSSSRKWAGIYMTHLFLKITYYPRSLPVQEIKHNTVELPRLLNVDHVRHTWYDHLLRAWNLVCQLLRQRELVRNIVIPDDDERRHAHLLQPCNGRWLQR